LDPSRVPLLNPACSEEQNPHFYAGYKGTITKSAAIFEKSARTHC